MISRTFFVTAPSFGRVNIFQSTRMQNLFIDVLRHYRLENRFHLHAFVMMSDHVHLLITPAEDTSLEKCMQLIKVVIPSIERVRNAQQDLGGRVQ
jgi:putative transposase